jgi:rhodanese-related sulfurtransferase
MKIAISVFGACIGVLAIVAGFLGFYSGPRQADNIRPSRPHQAPSAVSSTASTTPDPTPTAQPQVAGAAVITLAAATTAVTKNQGMILDVRPAAAFKVKHSKGAVNLDATLIEDGELPKIDTAKPVYIYGPDAARNQSIATILTTAGFTEVSVIAP